MFNEQVVKEEFHSVPAADQVPVKGQQQSCHEYEAKLSLSGFHRIDNLILLFSMNCNNDFRINS